MKNFLITHCKLLRNRRGFTLVELIICVAFLLIGLFFLGAIIFAVVFFGGHLLHKEW